MRFCVVCVMYARGGHTLGSVGTAGLEGFLCGVLLVY